MNCRSLIAFLAVPAALAHAQSSSFSFLASAPFTIDRAFHYRAESSVAQVRVVDEYMANPAQRVATSAPAVSGGAADFRWGQVPIVLHDHNPGLCTDGQLEVLASRQGRTRIKADNTRIQFTFGDAALDLLRIDEQTACSGGGGPIIFEPATARMDSWNQIFSVAPFVLRQQSIVTADFLQVSLDADAGIFAADGEFDAGAQAQLSIWRDLDQDGLVDPAVDALVFQEATQALALDEESLAGPLGDRLPPQAVNLPAGRYLAQFTVSHLFDTRLYGNLAESDSHSWTPGDVCTAAARLSVLTLSTGGPVQNGAIGQGN